MKMFCSLLLLMFVSLPLLAAEMDTRSPLFRSQSVNYDPTRVGYYEVFIGNQSIPNLSMLTFPLVSKGKFSVFGAVDRSIGGWDRGTRTFRISDQLGLGAVKEGPSSGVGFKYKTTDNLTLWVAGVHSQDTGRNVPTFGFNYFNFSF